MVLEQFNHKIIEQIKTKNALWHIVDMGQLEYGSALDLQQQLMSQAMAGNDHYILLLEHKPVITLGKRTKKEHILLPNDKLKQNGISVYSVNRGGSATFHNPGQLVGYVICKTSRVGGTHKLVVSILNSIVNTILNYGISVHKDHENPGVWTDDTPPKKIAAVGMQIIKGYSMHGFALNVNNDLQGFQYIIPCGLSLPVTSLKIEGIQKSMQNVKSDIISNLKKYLILPEN